MSIRVSCEPLARAALALAAVLSLAAPAAAQKSSYALDEIIGIVGDAPITKSDVMRAYIDKLQERKARSMAPESRRDSMALMDTVIQLMIDNKVLLQKGKEWNLEAPEIALTARVDQRIKEIRSSFPDEATFQNELKQSGMGTPDDLRRFYLDQARDDSTIAAVYKKIQSDQAIVPVTVTESEVEAEFKREQEHGQLPPRPAMITFRQLILPTTPTPAARAVAKAQADSLVALIKGGADFDRLARRFSMDSVTRDSGGLVDHVRRSQFVPELDRLLFGNLALKPGEVSDVTETAAGFHILRKDRSNAVEATVHDILIRPKIDSNDVGRSHRLADSIAGLVRKGVAFDSLVKKYNDWAGGEDGGLMGSHTLDSLPGTYQHGIADLKANAVSVFELPPAGGPSKWAIIQVVEYTPAGDRTYADQRVTLRNEMEQAAAYRATLDRIRKSTYVRISLDRAYSILDGS